MKQKSFLAKESQKWILKLVTVPRCMAKTFSVSTISIAREIGNVGRGFGPRSKEIKH